MKRHMHAPAIIADDCAGHVVNDAAIKHIVHWFPTSHSCVPHEMVGIMHKGNEVSSPNGVPYVASACAWQWLQSYFR